MNSQRFLFQECMRGKSLGRTLHNWHLRGTRLAGQIIDIGARDGASSYYRFLDIEGAVTYCDFYSEAESVLKIDLERPLPIPDQQYDAIIAMNVLEHVYHHQQLVNELARICKPGGHLIGFVPFLVQFHADPHDFFRYTHQALERILTDAGFEAVEIVPIGNGRLTTTAHLWSDLLKVRPLIFLIWWLAQRLDRLLNRRASPQRQYYIGLSFTARRPINYNKGGA